MRPLQKLSLWYLLASFIALRAMAQVNVRTTIVEYVVKREDSASSILHSFGIGTASSPYRIYGEDGFLAKMRRVNPNVDFNRLVTGSTLKVIVPIASGTDSPRTGGNTPVINPSSQAPMTSTGTNTNVKAVAVNTSDATEIDKPKPVSVIGQERSTANLLMQDRPRTNVAGQVRPIAPSAGQYVATTIAAAQDRPAINLAAAQDKPTARRYPQVQTPRNPPPAIPPPPVPPPPVSPLPPGMLPASPTPNADIPQTNRPNRMQAPTWTPAANERPQATPPQPYDDHAQPRQPSKTQEPIERVVPDEAYRDPAIPREFPSNTKTTQPYEPPASKVDEIYQPSTNAPYPKQEIVPAKPLPAPTSSAGVFDCSIRLEQAVVNVQAGNSMGIKREPYQVREYDDIASILYERGVGRPDNFAKLFGERGWIMRNKIYSAGRVDLDNLQAGQKITIIYPVQTKYDPCAAHATNVVSARPTPPVEANQYEKTAALNSAKDSAQSMAAQAALASQPPAAQQVEIVSPIVPAQDPRNVIADPANSEITTETLNAPPVIQPAVPSIQELAKLTPAELALLDPKAISQQLDETTLAMLDDGTLAAVPDTVIAEKAKDVSILEATQPGMAKLLQRFQERTASAYVGLRAGHSLATKKDALLSKVASYGLLVEMRQGFAKGLRLIADLAPKVEVETEGFEQYFEYNRVLLGAAMEFNGPLWFDLLHITPRIGRYHIAAKTPAGQTFWGEKVSEELNIAKAVSAGLEIDVELAQYFYVLRFWGGRDVVVPILKNGYKSTTTRLGLDAFIKGRSFETLGTHIIPNYVIFATIEDIQLSGAKDYNAKQQLQVNLPTAGIGISFTPH